MGRHPRKITNRNTIFICDKVQSSHPSTNYLGEVNLNTGNSVSHRHRRVWSDDLILPLRKIIGVRVSEMAILIAHARQFITSTVYNLETMLAFPIALSSDLNINELIAT